MQFETLISFSLSRAATLLPRFQTLLRNFREQGSHDPGAAYMIGYAKRTSVRSENGT